MSTILIFPFISFVIGFFFISIDSGRLCSRNSKHEVVNKLVGGYCSSPLHPELPNQIFRKNRTWSATYSRLQPQIRHYSVASPGPSWAMSAFALPKDCMSFSYITHWDAAFARDQGRQLEVQVSSWTLRLNYNYYHFDLILDRTEWKGPRMNPQRGKPLVS